MPQREVNTSSAVRGAGLRTLSLRQNILEDASDVARLASAGRLTELILHDNRLHTVRLGIATDP